MLKETSEPYHTMYDTVHNYLTNQQLRGFGAEASAVRPASGNPGLSDRRLSSIFLADYLYVPAT
jgi:hypothetical protein